MKWFLVLSSVLCVSLFSPFKVIAEDVDLGVYSSYWGTEDGEDAFGLGARFAFPVISDPFQFEFRISRYNDLTKNNEPDIQATPLEFGLAFRPDLPLLSPYASAGLGYYFFDASQNVSIRNEWGWYLATGLEFELPLGFGIFAELNYRHVESEIRGDLSNFDGLDFTNITADYDLSGFGANVGLNFKW
ncbi:MAG: outer membrane beta-barrel protein [Bdellovibrionales bacterium]|nr:outer membrane beta-barrel protein [Bdellovibrionales bacterium]